MKLNVSTKSNIMANMVEHFISTGETIKIFNCDFDVESHETYRDVTGTVISCDFVLSYDATKDIKESPSSDKPENKHNNHSKELAFELFGTGHAGNVHLESMFIPKGKVLRCYIEDIEQDENVMNKQELIDKAVEDLNGKLPSGHHESHYLYTNGIKFVLGIASGSDRDLPDVDCWKLVCTQSEFTKRARELGWVNGYKWGVEYPTNGKKPDLPDDVVVDVCYMGAWEKTKRRLVEDWGWKDARLTAFRIVDERYKPVEVEMSKSEPEMSKECLNKFPPVGSICVYTISGRCTSHVEITGHGKYGVLARIMPDSREETYHNWNAEKHRFNKIKSDRERFVDAVLDASSYFTVSLAEILYDAGCRFK